MAQEPPAANAPPKSVSSSESRGGMVPAATIMLVRQGENQQNNDARLGQLDIGAWLDADR